MKIETEVPFPAGKHAGGNYKYPWDLLEVGQSFLVKNRTVQQMASVANRASSRLGIKLSCRTTEEGVRVWRVS
jgi:hypothetical protein